MKLKFHTETKIIFAVLVLIIIAAVIFIALNYRKLKQPNPVSQNLAVHAQVKAASVPIRPRGN